MVAPSYIRRFTVDEYYAMAEAGILATEERVELLDGQVFRKCSYPPLRSSVLTRINTFLQQQLRNESCILSCKHPVRCSRYDEPEPDFSILKYQADFYASGHPGPSDVLLLAEVTVDSLERDRTVKAALYATHLIPTYWIVNLQDRQIEVYTQPKGGQYCTRQTFLPGEELELPGFGLKVAVEDLLGPPPNKFSSPLA